MLNASLVIYCWKVENKERNRKQEKDEMRDGSQRGMNEIFIA
jgi:hypothetical protein